MNHETDGRNRAKTVRLYPGIHISFYSLTAETESFPIDDGHSEQILEINYCRAGRIGWIRKNGSSVYLGPKDFSLHTMQAYADSRRTLPNGFYDGMTLRINLQELAGHPPSRWRTPRSSGRSSMKNSAGAPPSLLCGEQRDRDHFQFFL